jgi:hypothetical protein
VQWKRRSIMDNDGMWLLWIAAGVLVVALVGRRLVAGKASTADIDVGNVSEAWLADQKGKKN